MFNKRTLGTVEQIYLVNETEDKESLRNAADSEIKRIDEIKLL